MADSFSKGSKMLPLPINTAYVNECDRIFRQAADRQIGNLAPEKRGRVAESCAELGFSDDATRLALSATCDLIDFEMYGRHYVLTTAQRVQAITHIRDAARSIAVAVGDLSTNDRIALQLGVRSERGHLMLDGGGFESPLVFEAWAIAAQRLLDASPDHEGKGGRRPLRAEYAPHVASLAYAFEEMGLPVGRGGAFERFCAVVFDVAGVRATPEGAIRYYLSERKKRAQKAPENSSKNAGD
jgi:hypothetical protein